ncbi:hypothetical protein [Nesterenkonia marinintestina]|uniref:hypothetical protein n=1 Tax=Nesterenkonia marinintestina TaxID=2979865 RepID=UPI0021C00237|nr:hypothetical protein [Nesterenkonia sp. GX14115]
MTPPHDDDHPTGARPSGSRLGGVAAAWGAALILAVVLAVLAVWWVRTEVYSAEAAAEGYVDALTSGRGGEALGLLSDSAHEDLASQFDETDPPTDAGLLGGDALEKSTERLDQLSLDDDGEPTLTFTYDDEQHAVEVPVHSGETMWMLFDRWEITEEVVGEFEVDVPQSGAAGVERITVNGEPVDLEDGSVRLAAFLPTAAVIEADGPWVDGSADHLVLDDSEDTVQLDVEPSEEAQEKVREQVESYLQECADQQVLMPSGCPMGAATPHQVDPDTIDWTMPDISDLTVALGDDGWEVEGTQSLTAELDFEALDHFDGSLLNERFESDFSLDVEVEPVGDELRIAVTGADGETADD